MCIVVIKYIIEELTEWLWVFIELFERIISFTKRVIEEKQPIYLLFFTIEIIYMGCLIAIGNGTTLKHEISGIGFLLGILLFSIIPIIIGYRMREDDIADPYFVSAIIMLMTLVFWVRDVCISNIN